MPAAPVPPASAPDPLLRPCFLAQVVIDEHSDQQVVVLRERTNPGRSLPITIGTPEALAIDRALRGQHYPRPLTHDLVAQLLAATGLRLIEVRIVDLREGVFYAELHVLAGTTRHRIDCRPSDAFALLARTPDAGVQVAEAVLAEAAS